jgi:outer membrane protein assembly factor BamA
LFIIRNKAIIAAFLTVFCLLFSLSINAEDDLAELDEDSKTLVGIPLITSNPAMKTGFGGIGMYILKINPKDTVSPPSVMTAYGLYSTNDSYIFSLGSRLFLKEDNYRVLFALGTIRINNNFEYDFGYETPNVVYSELTPFAVVGASHQVVENFYAGFLYVAFKSKYRFDKGSDEENEFARQLFKQMGIEDNFTSSLGLDLSYDSKDYQYYPTAGIEANFRPMFHGTWLGGDNNYTNISYDINWYHGFSDRRILAARIAGGHSVGDVPFSGYQSYGERNSLRGYPYGKYRAENLFTIQAEYRWRFYKRLGMVAFAGTGVLWGNDEEQKEFEKDWLPSIGGGLRFMLAPEKRVNLRVDYAWGVNGNQGFYLGLMEAF